MEVKEDRGPRQLLVFCDGTNNTLTGGTSDTNVLRLFEALAPLHDLPRVLYYDPGVGSRDLHLEAGIRQGVRRRLDRLAGMASGQGIFENISQAYGWLMREYREGDSIWLFGFSRGAFTARSIAGMINLFGLIRPEHEVMLPTLLRAYFSNANGETEVKGHQLRRDDVANQIRASFVGPAGAKARVHFVGVWDTVESVGAPGISLKITSSGTIKGKRVNHVRHALSLDEHRYPFLPRLYEEPDFGEPKGLEAASHEEQSLRQQWFCGVHSDVGGGYEVSTAGLSNAALEWMVAEANLCGLGCPPLASWQPSRMATRVAHDPIYSTPWWAVMGMTVRSTRAGRPPTVVGAHVMPPRTTSVWNKGRPVLPLLVWAAVAAAALTLSGYMLMPKTGWSGFRDLLLHPPAWLDAMKTAANLAIAQASAWFDPQGPFVVASEPGACPRRALAFDMLFLVAYAYVLARFCSRAFARRFAWRDLASPAPTLRFLGFALPTMVAGDLVENALGIAGFSCGNGVFGQAFFCLGAFGSVAKFAGLLGCVILIGVGWLTPSRLARHEKSSNTPERT